MSGEDWYRNTEWNDRIERVFFAKLTRARSQRDQYLVLQAFVIARHDPEVALRLVDHYFETRKSDFDDVRALLAKAEAYRFRGDLAEAVRAYKAVLTREAELPSHKTRTCLDLPYFIACEELIAEYGFALSVLAKAKDALLFPLDRFIWHASKALIASAHVDDSEAKEQARKALEAAQVKTSDFQFHRNVGLVGADHAATIAKLRRLAG